jgi:hypothetical protein
MSIEHGILPGLEDARFPIDWYIQKSVLEHVVISGIHGDERSTVAPTKEVLERLNGQLRGIFYIPELIPQAGFQGTRENAQGLDGNRYAYVGTPVIEVAGLIQQITHVSNIQKIIHGQALCAEVALTIHGENEFDETYFYQEGNFLDPNQVDKWRDDMHIFGVPLHNGVDDSQDPTLGNLVIDGVVVGGAEGEGSIEKWLRSIAKTVICLEVPKDVSPKLQLAIINSAINRLVLGR